MTERGGGIRSDRWGNTHSPHGALLGISQTAKAGLPTAPFSGGSDAMGRYDVYDQDEERWACWSENEGYLSEWMTKRDYLKWYYVQYGCSGRKLPGGRTIYRTEADEKEAQREREQSQNR